MILQMQSSHRKFVGTNKPFPEQKENYITKIVFNFVRDDNLMQGSIFLLQMDPARAKPQIIKDPKPKRNPPIN
jgi:hypothetical protein